jgi:hypothetical protein
MVYTITLDQVLKEHIESLPAKRKKAHRRASRHALRLKSKRRPSGAVQSQSSGAGIQAAAGSVGEDGSTGAAAVAMTGPAAAAAGLSRASISSTRSIKSFDMNSTEDGGGWSFSMVSFMLLLCLQDACCLVMLQCLKMVK